MFVNTSDDSAILAEAFRRTTDNEYRKNEDAAVEVIDVEENEIKEVKDAAQEAVFGSETVENEKRKMCRRKPSKRSRAIRRSQNK